MHVDRHTFIRIYTQIYTRIDIWCFPTYFRIYTPIFTRCVLRCVLQYTVHRGFTYILVLHSNVRYGVPTISRFLKIIGLFCKKALQKRLYSEKETYNFKEPTNRSHPIVVFYTQPTADKVAQNLEIILKLCQRTRILPTGFTTMQ